MNQIVLRACANLAQASSPHSDSRSRRYCVKLLVGTILDRHAPGETIGPALLFSPAPGNAKIRERARSSAPNRRRHGSCPIDTNLL